MSKPFLLFAAFVLALLAVLFLAHPFLKEEEKRYASKVNQGPALQGNPGEIIRVEKAPRPLWPAGARSSRVIFYKTLTPEGRLVAASGTLILPLVSAGNKAPFLFQHGLTGVANRCAPSKGSPDILPYFSFYQPAFSTWLRSGHPLLLPDYQGLGVAGDYRLGNGASHARSSLDMLRAARLLEKDLAPAFVNLGHSQGGQSAVFLSRVAQDYLGEKSLGNVIYSPVAFYEAQAKLGSLFLQEPSPAGALLFLLLRAALLESGLDPREIFVKEVFASQGPLTKGGRSLWQRAREECLLSLIETFRTFPGSDLLQTSDWSGNSNMARLLEELKKMEVSSQEPLLILQGGLDSIVPSWVSQMYAKTLPRARYRLFPLADHNDLVFRSRFFVLKQVKRWSKDVRQR